MFLKWEQALGEKFTIDRVNLQTGEAIEKGRVTKSISCLEVVKLFVIIEHLEVCCQRKCDCNFEFCDGIPDKRSGNLLNFAVSAK